MNIHICIYTWLTYPQNQILHYWITYEQMVDISTTFMNIDAYNCIQYVEYVRSRFATGLF